ncbi:MAG: hypothetical protein FRX48_09625 [Lasallia pustulata]|uniref:DUF1989 domain-containing protein n=1 Tax=Lasallia pustulata TaxID=136370 RepID=A0A5M8PC99_9LECA|nr:MAG: hypothetical protein FRX48_09625 [Lasallia pustulata]
MSDSLQTIPARHGTATFVPSGHTIKIINTSGTQVIDTWAFALPSPPKKLISDHTLHKPSGEEQADKASLAQEQEPSNKQEPPTEESSKEKAPSTEQGSSKEIAPSPQQESTKEKESSKEQESSGEKEPSKEQESSGEQETSNDPEPSKSSEEVPTNSETADAKAGDEAKPKGWSAYIPSLGLGSGKSTSEPAPSSEKASGKEASGEKASGEETAGEKGSKGWSSYFPSGQGFTSYLPSKGLISAFAASHYRDPSKPYAEQLADFARTPVGAAGLSAATGSGPAGTLYAAYAAYDAQETTSVAPMEYMSMPHTRARTQRLVPKPDDTLVSNLREPLLTLIEDTSPGIHDTLIAACDPQRYKGLGVEKWEEHGSCSENLVLALKELNEKAGLKGAQAVGADIIVEKVPAPLNLFMNIPWNREGKLRYEGPAGDKGDSVTFRAERDVIVVMSACPQDILAINGGKPMDAHFIVQEPESKVPVEEEQSKEHKDSVEEGEEKHS